jgi:O-glycosyl hydrolase
MQLVVKITVTFQLIFLFAITLFAQNSIDPIASYSFINNSVVDEAGSSELFLRNNAGLYNDQERGSVLRFSAADKSYAVFNKPLLNSDHCAISFYFYWEETGAKSWHQLFEIHNKENNSNLFFTPQNGWGKNECSLISYEKEYDAYETVSADQISKNKWKHITITFNGKVATIYMDGELASQGYLMFTPLEIQGDSLFLGGNPYRSNNYYISARLDDIKIFDKTLAANQVQALSKGIDLPEPENMQTNWETTGNPVECTLNMSEKYQTIQNFGSSDGWNTQRIGKYWPLEKKEKLAELLFSVEKDNDGNPKGIGLSAWRFNIGAGTAEQGDASRISSEYRRTEGFLNNDGTYNWDKQIGQQWFLKEAVNKHQIHHVIGWQNSPPVQYTSNNLGFRDYGTPIGTILKQEYFDDFGKFLADVADHFESEGIHFDYISPLNEPQYGWNPSESGGTVSQEGTPWTNEEIHDVALAIDNEFTNRNIQTKIFLSEAGAISYHTSGTGHASNQLYKFWNPYSSLSLVGKPSFANIVSYHSYWQDFGNALIDNRIDFYDKTKTLNPILEAWQTEYSLLGEGYRDGYPDEYKLSEMESALALARVIMTDLNVTNTTGWQWWSTFGMGKHSGEARFCLIEAFTKENNSDGVYHLNKLFYTLGNFSHFIRPGMKRIGCSRSDNLTLYEESSDVMFSAYTNAGEDKLVVVAANHTNQSKEISILFDQTFTKTIRNPVLYLTNSFENLAKQNVDFTQNKITIPAYSVITFTADLSIETGIREDILRPIMNAYFRSNQKDIVVYFDQQVAIQRVQLTDIRGNMVYTKSFESGSNSVCISAQSLTSGVYIVTALANNAIESKKIIVR